MGFCFFLFPMLFQQKSLETQVRCRKRQNWRDNNQCWITLFCLFVCGCTGDFVPSHNIMYVLSLPMYLLEVRLDFPICDFVLLLYKWAMLCIGMLWYIVSKYGVEAVVEMWLCMSVVTSFWIKLNVKIRTQRIKICLNCCDSCEVATVWLKYYHSCKMTWQNTGRNSNCQTHYTAK